MAVMKKTDRVTAAPEEIKEPAPAKEEASTTGEPKDTVADVALAPDGVGGQFIEIGGGLRIPAPKS